MTDTTQVTGQATPTGDTQNVADTNGATPTADTSLLGGDGAKPAEGTPIEGKPVEGEKKTEIQEPVVPEKYEFKMPDGVQVDSAAAEQLSSIAKELKLTAEQAQKFADVGAAMAQRQVEAHTKTVSEWADAVRTDKEIGGDALTENLVFARKTIDSFGSPELRSLLDSSGLGNHPEMVKLAVRVGKAISEDKFVGGRETPGASSGNDAADAFYPTMKKG